MLFLQPLFLFEPVFGTGTHNLLSNLAAALRVLLVAFSCCVPCLRKLSVGGVFILFNCIAEPPMETTHRGGKDARGLWVRARARSAG